MIAGLLALAMQGGNPATELIDNSASYVSVQAIVALPKLSGHEIAEMQVLADTMAIEVEGFSRPEMLNFAGMAGDTLRITLMPDHLRIQIGVPPAAMKSAIGYIDQILHNSRLMPEPLNKAIAEIPTRKRSVWSTAVDPYTIQYSRLKRDEIVELYQRICRPENVYLTVGGPIKSGEASAYWDQKVKDWKVGRLPKPSLDTDPPKEILAVPGNVSTVELRGKTLVGNDPEMSTKILAVIALGSGKGSAMFERLREGKGWSYRQEAIITPTLDGFTPRFLMATNDKTEPFELAKGMKEELTAAVAEWKEADLNRARGMAEGILQRGLEMSPFYFNPYWPITTSLHDRTFMAAYWPMKTGREWSPNKLLGQMALATVEDLKASATSILETAQPRILIANN